MQVIWKETSTQRGLIKGIGCIIALVFLWFQDVTKAVAVITIFNMLGNVHGVTVPDVSKDTP